MSIIKTKKTPDIDILSLVLHNIQSPLRFIGTITQELALHCKEMDKNMLVEHTNMVNNSIASLQQYCNKISAWRKFENKQLKTNSIININQIFTDIETIYLPLVKFKKVAFNIVKTDIYYFSDEKIIFTILLNLIDNAYKNTNSGFISLEAIKENDIIKIIVTDTGEGMTQQLIDDILIEKIYMSQSSLGYYIITDLLKKINGSIKINSNKNIGTTVTISLSDPEKYDSVYQGS